MPHGWAARCLTVRASSMARAPDLDLHSARIIRSAEAMGMIPPVDAETVQGLMEEGCARFGADRALYLRPMMWSRDSAPGIIDVVPENTGFSICIEALDMPSVGGLFADRLAVLPPTPRYGGDRGQGGCALRQQCPHHGRCPQARLFPTRCRWTWRGSSPKPHRPMCSWSAMALSSRRCPMACS